MKTISLLLAITALCLGSSTPPKIVASKVEREIIVSHWGEMVHIKDYVELENRSPSPKKEFFRGDYPVGPKLRTADVDYFHFFMVRHSYYFVQIGFSRLLKPRSCFSTTETKLE